MQLLTHSALLKALGWSLFNSLWQIALLWTLYKLVTAVFRRASAHVRHGLAFAFLGLGVTWSIVTFFINYFFSGAGPETGLWGEDLFHAGENSGYAFLDAGRQLINEALPYCSFLYLLVLAFLLIRYSNQYLRSRQLKEQGLSKIQPDLRIFVEETGRLMGIRKEIRIWVSSLVEGPVTLGFLKPVILIPVAMVNNLSPQQVEAILLHELAHIKRYDYLLHLGATIIEVLFFFNPFVQWLIRDIKKEREHRCDDVVIQQFRYSPQTYVSALLSLASKDRSSQRQLALAAAGSSDQLLLQRVRRILRLGEVKDRPGAKALIFMLLTFAGTFMLLFGNRPSRGAMAAANPAVIPSFLKNTDLASAPGQYIVGSFPGNITGQDSFLSIEQSMTIIKTGAPTTKTTGRTGVDIEMTAREKNPGIAPRKKSRTAPLDDPDKEWAVEDNRIIAAQNAAGENEPMSGKFAATFDQDERAYSMEPSDNITVTASSALKAIILRQPFVPNSSFSFIEDTSRLIEKYAYLQSLAAHELEEAVKKMQTELQVQLKVLQVTRSKEEQTSLKAQKQLLEEQLKLQEQFLRKQQDLQKKLERAGKVRLIVFI